jgi:hypothetical protein
MAKKLQKEKEYRYEQNAEETVAVEATPQKAEITVDESSTEVNGDKLIVKGSLFTSLADLYCMVNYGKSSTDKIAEYLDKKFPLEKEKEDEVITADAASIEISQPKPTVIDGSLISAFTTLISPFFIKPETARR